MNSTNGGETPQSSSWYKKWHDGPHHKFVHWMVLLVALGVIGVILIHLVGHPVQVALDLSSANNSASNNSNTSDFAKGEILVKFKPGLAAADKSKSLKGWGLSEESEIPKIGVKKIRVPVGAEEEVVNALSHNPNVEFAEVNGVLDTTLMPNDPQVSNQWHLAKIQAPAAWDLAQGSPNIIVAIPDGGVSAVSDLSPLLVPGYNFIENNTDTHDFTGHGTLVAGVLADTNNALNNAGVSWNTKIMPLVITETGPIYFDQAASAIVYAADHGANVINESWVTGSDVSTIHNAEDYAYNKGVVVVAAAGNNGNSSLQYPAAYSSVLSVSATDSSDKITSWSSYGSTVDISAPGLNVYTLSSSGSVTTASGTSLASPIVSGVAALVKSANPQLSNAQIINILETSSDDLGTPGRDDYYGYGRVNAYKAVQVAKSTVTQKDTTAPSSTITVPSSGSTVSALVNITVSASDNSGVSKVDLYRDGVLLGTDTASPYSFAWNTVNDNNGNHSLVAKATDAAGNVGTSAAVTVTVNNITNDATAPVVNIKSPADNSNVPNKGNLQVQVQASDNVGVKEIDILVDNSVKSTCSSSTSCSASINTKKMSKGTHIITAKAKDAAGNTSSTSITIFK